MKKKFKIDRKELFLFLIVMPFLKPYNVTLIPALDNIFKIWKVASTAYIICAFLSKKQRAGKTSIYLFLFCITWMFSLVLNSGPIADYGNNIMSILGLRLLFETNMNNDEFKRNISKIIYKTGAVYMVLNCITAWMGRPFFAAGMNLDDNANFLGGDNYSAFILIVLCGLMFFYDVKYKKKIRTCTWIFNIIGLISLIIPFSFAGMISYIILLTLILCSNYKFVRKAFNWKNALLICGVLVLLISYFHLDVVVRVFLGKLDKSGFNGRNMIWPRSITAIGKKFVLGYGGLTAEQAATWIIAGANHTHNILLQIPFSTGIIGTFFFVMYLRSILKNTLTNRDKPIGILLMTLSSFILCSIFDFYIGLIYMYVLLDFIWIYKKGKRIGRNTYES